MTILLEDSFNRTGTNLGTNPSGRFYIPVGDFKLDGQVVQTETTVSASTSPYAYAYGMDPGTNFGQTAVRAKRGTAQVKAIGVVARAHTTTGAYDRYWFGWTNESGTEKFEIRVYYATTLYSLRFSANASTFGITADLDWHTFTLSVVRHGTTGSLVDLVAKYDSTVIFNVAADTDFLTLIGSATYRTPGFQCTTSSTWVGATDYAQFDLVQFDDLATPSIESAPTLTAESSLIETSVTAEIESIGVSGTFPPPDFSERITERYFVNRSTSEAGYETTFLRFSEGRKLFDVSWQTISLTDLLAIQVYLGISSGGNQQAFGYAAPDGITYSVHFVGGTFQFEQYAPNAYSASAVLEELL